MKTTVCVLLLSLAIPLLAQIVSGLVSVNVTRLLKNDKFTNPNQTAVNNCRASGQGYSYDTCKTFDSKDTRAACTSLSGCCESCQCGTGYPTYLAHLGKCVSLTELNWDVFGQGSNGCDPRLELKGKKGGGDDDDDRDDDDDDDDHSGKHKDVCKAKSWNPPVIDFRSSSKPKIKFCHKKGVESCSLVGARYSGFVKWRNITNFKQTFWDMKIKKDIVLQWNQGATSRLTGNIIVINLLCKQKKGKPDFPACFIFKSAGTHIVTPPQPQSTTPTKTTTTAKPSTTKAKPSSASTTKSTTTTTKPTTKETTTAPKLSTTTKTTTSPKTTAKPTTTETTAAAKLSTATKTTTSPKTTANPATTKPTRTKTTTAAKLSTTKTTTAPMITITKPATTTTTASTTTTKPKTTASSSMTKPTKTSTAPSGPNIKSTTTQKARETTSPPRTQTTSDVTPTEPPEPTEPIEPTEPTEPTEPEEPTEPAEPTEPIEPGGVGKISEQSRESSGAGKTVTIVAVLFALLAVLAFCVMTYYLKKWKQRKGIAAIKQTNVQFGRQGTAQDKPDEHIYEGQNNVYQLLRRDEKPSGDNPWEPPSYQGLARGTTESAWVEGEVYTNPSMYQDLPKKGMNCGENLPAYLPLAKQPTRAEASIYECSYMALNGENDKTKETMNTENPYYYKVEPDNKVGETTDAENPYYFKLEDHDKVKETVDKENP